MTRTFPVSDRRRLPCPAPGIYEGVPAAEYHQWAAMHSTALPAWIVSGKEGACAWDGEPKKDTAAMRLGRLLHSAILEPEDFAERFVIADGPINERTGKPFGTDTKAYAEWLASLDRPLVGTAEAEQVFAMRRAVLTHETGRALKAANARRELSIVWDDPSLGFRCKARLDFYIAGLIADLKTSECVEPAHFNSKAWWDYSYHLQTAWYLRGASQVGLSVERGFSYVVVQSRPPHDILVAEWQSEAMDLAWAKIEVAAEQIRKFLDREPLSGVCPEPLMLTVPASEMTTQRPVTPLIKGGVR